MYAPFHDVLARSSGQSILLATPCDIFPLVYKETVTITRTYNAEPVIENSNEHARWSR